MPGPIRSLPVETISGLYAPDFGAEVRGKGSPKRIGIIDKVSISDAALRRFRESQRVRSSETVPSNTMYKAGDKDFQESLKVLGIESAGLGREEIKKAFVNSLKKYHPDVHYASNSETRKLALEKTRKIIEAYRNIERNI